MISILPPLVVAGRGAGELHPGKPMITELALLRIRRDTDALFEAAFASVMPLLVAADGYISHRLVAAMDHADLFLLEVAWRDLAAHTEQFEASSAHAEFMAALEPFLAGEPIVLHVENNGARRRDWLPR